MGHVCTASESKGSPCHRRFGAALLIKRIDLCSESVVRSDGFASVDNEFDF